MFFFEKSLPLYILIFFFILNISFLTVIVIYVYYTEYKNNFKNKSLEEIIKSNYNSKTDNIFLNFFKFYLFFLKIYLNYSIFSFFFYCFLNSFSINSLIVWSSLSILTLLFTFSYCLFLIVVGYY